jgi:hypothetical protein
MFRCNRCGQYYVPGFLDCHCQVVARRLHSADVSPSPGCPGNRVVDTLSPEAAKSVLVADLQGKLRSSETPIPRG